VRRAYLYAGDLFKLLDLSWGELVELAERPEAVLERFRGEVEELAGPVGSFRLRKAVVAGGGEAVVEYVARALCKHVCYKHAVILLKDARTLHWGLI
jgi:hypothetical protein